MPGLEHLEFMLDLDAKVDGAVKLLGTLDRSIATLHQLDVETAKAVTGLQRVDRASQHGAESHKKHGAALWQLGHHYDEAKKKALEFAEGLGLIVAFEAVEKLVDKVVELGSEIVTAAAKAQRFDMSFKLALGNEAGGELLEYLEEIAKYTTLTDDELKGVAGTLVRVGFEGEKFRRALAAAGDIGSMPGGSIEEALNGLAEIKRRGQVNDRMLRPLGMGEEDFLKKMAERTGMGVETIKKKIEKGTFDTNVALETFYSVLTAKTGKTLGGGWVEMSKGVEARLKHLKDVPDQYFQGLSKTDAFQRFNDMLGDFLKRLDPETATGKRLSAALEQSFTKLVDSVSKLDMNKFTADIEQAVKALPTIVDGLLKLAGALWQVGKAVAWLYEHTVPGQLFLGHLESKNKGDKLLDQDQARRSTQKLLGDGETKTAKDFIRDSLFETGRNGGKGLAGGLRASKKDVAEAGADVGATAGDSAAGPKGVDAHSPSRVFERLGRMSGEGYVKGIEASTASIDDAAGRAVMADVVAPGAMARPAGAGTGGPIQVTVNVTTNVGPGSDPGGGAAAGQQIGEQVAAAVEHLLPGALQSAFQRMQQEAGS